MILDERSAAAFINGYPQLLLEICGPIGGEVKLLERTAVEFECRGDLVCRQVAAKGNWRSPI